MTRESTTCSTTDVPGWYAQLNDRYGTDIPVRVTGRIQVKNSDLYIPIYRPINTYCPAYGTSSVMIMKQGCGGAVSEVYTGTGLSTSVVSDSDGNLYVGLSNKDEDHSGYGVTVTEDTKRVANMVKIDEGEASSVSSSSSVTPGIRIKSWRQLFN